MREGRHIQLDADATFGVPITLIEYAGKQATQPIAHPDGAVTGLDHVVIRTTHPNRAAALYGARLGLDMRLDRTEPRWGARLMFFRCGDLIVEVVHNLNEEPSDAPDKLWGLSWRVANADAAHARLKSSGFDVSEIRTGRKPGTRVFTVRNNTLGVPTLMVEPAGR
jgi:catechol 2,3-dioxygenase-like lactoylglutathione lyase family enzyme